MDATSPRRQFRTLGRRSARAAVMAALVVVLLACHATAAQPTAHWTTGVSLKRQLAEPAGLAVSGVPLRKAIEDLCRAQSVSILIDRRVDPDQPLTLTINDRPLEEILGQIAQRCHFGMTLLGPVVYLGPVDHAERLRTLAELRREEARARAGAAERLLASAALRWPDFATPRDVLTRLASEGQLTIVGLEQVPHDLWAGADLAPLPLVDRLTLVAGQFDLTFRIEPNGRSLTLIPIPANVWIVRSYPVGAQAARLAQKWAAMLSAEQVKVVDTKVYVRGTLEEHERLAASLHSSSATPAKTSVRKPSEKRPAHDAEKRYTLNQAKGQLDLLLTQLGERLGVEVRIDRDAMERAGISLRQQVTVSVTDATLDELFTALLKPAGCKFRRQGKVIEVLPAAKE